MNLFIAIFFVSVTFDKYESTTSMTSSFINYVRIRVSYLHGPKWSKISLHN